MVGDPLSPLCDTCSCFQATRVPAQNKESNQIIIHPLQYVGITVETPLRNTSNKQTFSHWTALIADTKGTFYLSELTGQDIPVVIRISLLIKDNHSDQSNPKYYAQRRSFFSKTSYKKPISLLKCLVRPWSGRPVLTFGKRPKS